MFFFHQFSSFILLYNSVYQIPLTLSRIESHPRFPSPLEQGEPDPFFFSIFTLHFFSLYPLAAILAFSEEKCSSLSDNLTTHSTHPRSLPFAVISPVKKRIRAARSEMRMQLRQLFPLLSSIPIPQNNLLCTFTLRFSSSCSTLTYVNHIHMYKILSPKSKNVTLPSHHYMHKLVI